MLDERFWARYFRVYDTLNAAAPYRHLLEDICNELDIRNGEKILDAGCGTGNLALLIKEKGGEVTCLDNCTAALEIYKKKDAVANIVLADLRKRLPFSDNYFDKIASNNTLYLLSKREQQKVISEFKRVLKVGGKVVLSEPKSGGSSFKIYISAIKEEIKENGISEAVLKITSLFIPVIKILYYNLIIKRERSEHFFRAGEQEKLLTEAGFSVVTSDREVYTNQAILVTGKKLCNGTLNKTQKAIKSN